MCNYNTPEEYLREAVESILNQTYTNFELIISDDASREENLAVIESFSDPRIVLIKGTENRGISHATNKGLERVRGEYIARMDSDDIALPTRFEEQVAYMEAHTDVDVLASKAKIFGAQDGVLAMGTADPEELACLLFFGCRICHPTTMFRTDFFRRAGLQYNESFPLAVDYEIWYRFLEKGAKIVEQQKVLLHYRSHQKQVTTAQNNRQTYYGSEVRRFFLAGLGLPIEEGDSTIQVHYSLCTATMNENVSVQQLDEWANTLLDANEKSGKYPKDYFEKNVYLSLCLLALKYIQSKRSDWGELRSFPTFKKSFSPRFLAHDVAYFTNRFLQKKK